MADDNSFFCIYLDYFTILYDTGYLFDANNTGYPKFPGNHRYMSCYTAFFCDNCSRFFHNRNKIGRCIHYDEYVSLFHLVKVACSEYDSCLSCSVSFAGYSSREGFLFVICFEVLFYEILCFSARDDFRLSLLIVNIGMTCYTLFYSFFIDGVVLEEVLYFFWCEIVKKVFCITCYISHTSP